MKRHSKSLKVIDNGTKGQTIHDFLLLYQPCKHMYVIYKMRSCLITNDFEQYPLMHFEYTRKDSSYAFFTVVKIYSVDCICICCIWKIL